MRRFNESTYKVWNSWSQSQSWSRGTGLGLEICGLGLKLCGLGLEICGLGLELCGLGLEVCGLGLGLEICGLGLGLKFLILLSSSVILALVLRF